MNPDWNVSARQTVQRCRTLAGYTEEPGWTTRTYLSAPMHDVHRALTKWLAPRGCAVSIDAAGNLRAVRAGRSKTCPTAVRLIIGSHLDTVIHAGAFDGILGVVMGVALLESLGPRDMPFDIELIGFSEEEGVRYGAPFLGSRAVTGALNEAAVATMTPAIRNFGLDPAELPLARLRPPIAGYLEFHIEQGPSAGTARPAGRNRRNDCGPEPLRGPLRRQCIACGNHARPSAQRRARRRGRMDRRSRANHARDARPRCNG